jgi:hypothetical protein
MQQSVCQLLCDELRLSDTLYDSSSAYTADTMQPNDVLSKSPGSVAVRICVRDTHVQLTLMHRNKCVQELRH